LGADALAHAERAATILARDPRVQLVYVFGSTAATSRHPRDVDLAVLTDPPLSLDELMRTRADLVDAIRAPIDLVSLTEASIVLAHEVAVSGWRALSGAEGLLGLHRRHSPLACHRRTMTP